MLLGIKKPVFMYKHNIYELNYDPNSIAINDAKYQLKMSVGIIQKKQEAVEEVGSTFCHNG